MAAAIVMGVVAAAGGMVGVTARWSSARFSVSLAASGTLAVAVAVALGEPDEGLGVLVAASVAVDAA